MMNMKTAFSLCLFQLLVSENLAFQALSHPVSSIGISTNYRPQISRERVIKSTKLRSGTENIDLISLAGEQENFGFAIVFLGEAIWSFIQRPSLSHAKILAPAILNAAILILVAGPPISSRDPTSLAFGLEVATACSFVMIGSCALRLANPSPSPKEAAALGLIIAFAAFFSFSQNLLVGEFVTFPSIPLPHLPEIGLPSPSFPSICFPRASCDFSGN